jgi:hypothetical protein
VAKQSREPKPLGFSQTFTVLTPPSEQMLPVSIQQWEQFMRRIERAADPVSWLGSFGWACVGFAGSALLTAVTFPFSAEFTRQTVEGNTVTREPNLFALIVAITSWVLVVFASILGVIAILFARTRQQDSATILHTVVEDMQAYQKRHIPVVPPAGAPPPASPPATELPAAEPPGEETTPADTGAEEPGTPAPGQPEPPPQ